MNKLLAVGILGLALGLAGNQARAHDEAAYFVLGTIVGSALNGHHARYASSVHYVPARYYPAPTYGYYSQPRHVVIHKHDYRQRYYRPGRADHRWQAHRGHRYDSHRGKNRHRRGR